MGVYSETVELTEARVRKAQPGNLDGRAVQRYYLDKKLTGFGLSVSASGERSYFVMRRVNGRKVRFTFARAVEVSHASARARAQELLARMTAGVNPVEEKKQKAVEAARARHTGMILDEAIDLYASTLRAKKKSERSVEHIELLRVYLPDWLPRPLSSITRAEVRERHALLPKQVAAGKFTTKRKAIARAGFATANFVLARFGQTYNRARRELPTLDEHILASVDFFEATPREKKILPGEFPAWFEALESIRSSGALRDSIEFVLFTGLRRGDATAVRWEHVDFERRLLHLPTPKGGAARAFDLPLSEHLVSLLRRRQKDPAATDYVFPSETGGHILAPRHRRNPVLKRYGPHDLRRTFATVASDLGISPYTIMSLLNHKPESKDILGLHYAQPTLEAKREAMERISARLLELGKPNVIPFPSGGRRNARAR